MELLISEGVDTFVEVGPGKVLSGLMRQISREVKCFNVEDAASLKSTAAALALSRTGIPACHVAGCIGIADRQECLSYALSIFHYKRSKTRCPIQR